MMRVQLLVVIGCTFVAVSCAKGASNAQKLRKNAVESAQKGDCKTAIKVYSELVALKEGQNQDTSLSD